MTNDEWLKLFEEAYLLQIRDDLRYDNWEKMAFDEKEKLFLLSDYSKEYASQHKEHILKIVQLFTRLLFKKAAQGFKFCDPLKINNEFGKSLEEHYHISSGPFLNFAYSYWTLRIELDEDQNKHLIPVPLFFPILRTVEMNIAGSFFPSGSKVNKENQKQILNEFAPEINAERFFADNPLISKRSGCLSTVIILLILIILILILFGV